VKTPSKSKPVRFNLPLNYEQAEALYDRGREAVIFVLMELAALAAGRLARGADPSTPSGMVPVYEKLSIRKRRKKLKRPRRDALRLCNRDELTDEAFASRRSRLDGCLDASIETESENKNAKRLVEPLRRYRDASFTFLDHGGAGSPDNNHAIAGRHAERQVRPAVIMRKNQLRNRSRNRADAQAILMSVYRTLKLRGLDPLETIVSALRLHSYRPTAPLPEGHASDG